MKRSIWSAVLMTLLILFIADLVANEEERAAITGGVDTVASAIVRSGIVRAITSTDGFRWIGALGALLVLSLVVARGLRSFRGRRACPSKTTALAQRGRSVRRIARQHRMSQDAVRAKMRVGMMPPRRAGKRQFLPVVAAVHWLDPVPKPSRSVHKTP